MFCHSDLNLRQYYIIKLKINKDLVIIALSKLKSKTRIFLKTVNFYLIIIVIFLFQGCVTPNFTMNKTVKKEKPFQSTVRVRQKTSVEKIQKRSKQNRNFIDIKTTQTIKIPKVLKFTGSIKGVIRKIKFDKKKKAWLYEIQATDVSNGKLPYAKFYHYKKLANKGDLVYIILNNSHLQNLFFIKRTNKIEKKVSYVKKIKKIKKTHKKSKQRKVPDIGLPIVEHITF